MRGRHPILFEERYTIAHLEIVAGETLFKFSASKITLVFGNKLIRSPFERVNNLLSSSTEFKFSTHMASIGPSQTIQ